MNLRKINFENLNVEKRFWILQARTDLRPGVSFEGDPFADALVGLSFELARDAASDAICAAIDCQPESMTSASDGRLSSRTFFPPAKSA